MRNYQNEQETIIADPYGPSYPQSAAQFILYRVAITVCAVILIMIGKSNLPDDSVKCIEDQILNFLEPVTNFYKQHQTIGLISLTIMQLIVDIELIAMAALWYFKGNSFRYPFVLSVLGASKIMLNILFQIRPIDNAFTDMLIPSLVFGDNFKNTYFFSGVTAFMLFNLLQLKKMGYSLLYKSQIILLIYCVFILLSMKQNFFMDIVTALVFAHFVFVFVSQRSNGLDKSFISLIDRNQTTKNQG